MEIPTLFQFLCFEVVKETNKIITNKQRDAKQNESHTSHDSLSSVPFEAMIVPGRRTSSN